MEVHHPLKIPWSALKMMKVVIYGSGRVRFQRDMGVNNALGPGVAVIWNPNLLLNFPAQLTDALTDWREVAP